MLGMQLFLQSGSVNAMGCYADHIEVAEFIAFLRSDRGLIFITGGTRATLRSPTGYSLKFFTSNNDVEKDYRAAGSDKNLTIISNIDSSVALY